MCLAQLSPGRLLPLPPICLQFASPFPWESASFPIQYTSSHPRPGCSEQGLRATKHHERCPSC